MTMRATMKVLALLFVLGLVEQSTSSPSSETSSTTNDIGIGIGKSRRKKRIPVVKIEVSDRDRDDNRGEQSRSGTRSGGSSSITMTTPRSNSNSNLRMRTQHARLALEAEEALINLLDEDDVSWLTNRLLTFDSLGSYPAAPSRPAPVPSPTPPVPSPPVPTVPSPTAPTVPSPTAPTVPAPTAPTVPAPPVLYTPTLSPVKAPPTVPTAAPKVPTTPPTPTTPTTAPAPTTTVVPAPSVAPKPTSLPAPTAPTTSSPVSQPSMQSTMWDVIMTKSDQFMTFIETSKMTGFDEVLQDPTSKATVFVPTDSAFASNLLPAGLLDKYFDFDTWTDEYITRLMYCHDVAGEIIMSTQFQNGSKVIPCLDPVDPAFVVVTPPLTLTKSTLSAPANLVDGETDLVAQNGVIHVTDQVLTTSFLRSNLPEFAEALGGYSILLDLITACDLLDFASSDGPYTIWAPQDTAWLRYGQDFINNLRSNPTTTRRLLLNHVVSDVIVPTQIEDGTELLSAAGFTLVVSNVSSVDPRSYTINGVKTFPALVGILASNAKINTIDDILFLPDDDDAMTEPPNAAPVGPATQRPTTIGNNSTLGTTWDVIMSRPDEFATFISASKASGFDSVLMQTDVSRTVFVPNEDAFRSVMPANLLEKYLDFDTWSPEYIETLLFCHEVANEVVLSTDLVNGTTFSPCVDTIDPSYLITLPPPSISKQTMPVPAEIVDVDLLANNGVVHVVSQVLTNSFLRFDLVESAEFSGQFSILLDLIEMTGLLDFAQGEGPYTLFAPSDRVFQSYGEQFIKDLKADIEGTRAILLNHIVADVIVPCCLNENTQLFSMAGFPLVLDNYTEGSPSNFTVNGIRTLPPATDLLASNAKMNTITDILFLPTTPTSAPNATSPVDQPTQIPSSPTTAPEALELPATVWDVITAQPEKFASLILAAESVKYDTVWQTESDVTIFAPNEDAFASILPADLLSKYLDFDVWTDEFIKTLLDCHDVGRTMLSTDLVGGVEFFTCRDMYDPEFIITSPPPTIEKATFTAPAEIVEIDLQADTGVVHVVNQVLTTGLFRFDTLEALEALGQFVILLELVQVAGLANYISGDGPFTLFAPTDSAFDPLDADELELLRTNPMRTRMMLMNHLAPDLIIPANSGNVTFVSGAGFPIVLDNFGETGGFDVNGIPAEPFLTNVLASNGKINAISGILLPPIFNDMENVDLDAALSSVTSGAESAPVNP